MIFEPVKVAHNQAAARRQLETEYRLFEFVCVRSPEAVPGMVLTRLLHQGP